MTTHKVKIEWQGQRHTTRLQTENGEVILFKGVPVEVVLTFGQIQELMRSGNFRIYDTDLVEEEKIPPKPKVRRKKVSIRSGRIVQS